MISREEHEAWDALLACQGQMRLAPSGHVIGIDLSTALRLGAARGCDVAVLPELLPAAEAGLVEALCSDRVRDDGALISPQQCPLTARLPEFQCTRVTSGSDPKPTAA